MRSSRRILFCASYSVVEPLGLLHLAGLARDMGWERRIHLVRTHDYEPFFRLVRDFRPDIVGFSIYTGAHLQLFAALQRLRQDFPQVRSVVGGPHATYFPAETAEFADYVVMSEGFGQLRRILHGSAMGGILPMTRSERFPHPDRDALYRDYPEHAASPIKSFITMTGCPYRCTYCYNSSEPSDIEAPNSEGLVSIEGVSERAGAGIANTGIGRRLFPHNIRSVDDVIRETREVASRWPTEVLYCQDDVHGFDSKAGGMLDKLADRWPSEVGLPYHAQMRWEMTSGESGDRRLTRLRDADCFGLTLAIEAADPVVRREVLDRAMAEETILEGMRKVVSHGFRTRTEQITGLPYGATTVPTRMNLEADLEVLELNIHLREATGGPDVAWASTFAPYAGTKLGQYCRRYGHYEDRSNHDVPDTFFESSVLRFPAEWVGPSLETAKAESNVWLARDELESYRERNAELRRHFPVFSLVPRGHELARDYLSGSNLTYQSLTKATEKHLLRLQRAGDSVASEIQRRIQSVSQRVTLLPGECSDTRRDLSGIAPYLAWLPKASDVVTGIARRSGQDGVSPATLATAIRHHLYEKVLYRTRADRGSSEQCIEEEERYPPKF